MPAVPGAGVGGRFWGISRGFGSASSTCASKLPLAPEKPPHRGLVPISPAPPTAVTAPTGRGAASPGRATSQGYLGMSPLPSSQLMPHPPSSARSKERAPQTQGKTAGKAPTSFAPRPISQHVFKFAFFQGVKCSWGICSRRLRDTGGPRLRPPPQQLPRTVQYKHTLPPPRPLPTDVEKYKNPKNFCNNLVRIAPLGLCK